MPREPLRERRARKVDEATAPPADTRTAEEKALEVAPRKARGTLRAFLPGEEFDGDGEPRGDIVQTLGLVGVRCRVRRHTRDGSIVVSAIGKERPPTVVTGAKPSFLNGSYSTISLPACQFVAEE